jgi:hypothetical protein
MKLVNSQNRINELMARFVAQVKGATSMSRTDLNKVAETILIPLLNEIYGWNLQNANYSENDNNYPGIDLVDEAQGVSIQVTATPDLQKIKHTLEQFVKNSHYVKYPRLIIFILREKQNSYSEQSINQSSEGRFDFVSQRDIWDYRNILKEVANFQIDRTRKVQEILESNFGEDELSQQLPDREVSDKVTQIIEGHEFFVQRSEQEQISAFFREQSNGLLLVMAGAGFGKSALLSNCLKTFQAKNYFVAYHFFNQRDEATCNLSRAYQSLLEQLYVYYNISHKYRSGLEKDQRKELYNLVRDNSARADQPLIILIDALDEAENTFSPPFPTPLPENVFVIVSIREGADPDCLSSWTDTAEIIPLERLPRQAIMTWLEQANAARLAELAKDSDFVDQLDEITQGYPLYLQYLIDELNHAMDDGQDVRLVLRKTPKGFEQYVNSQLYSLDKLDLPNERRQFFALLAAAKGTLEKADVKAITGMTRQSLSQLRKFWQVTRWLKISEDGRFYAFAHLRLGEAFATELEEDAEDAVQNLINYCKQWQSHNSPYALRHYTEHLKQSRQWDELFSLARNSEFTEAQRKAFVNEPSLMLRTAQTALWGAIEIDKPDVVSEFLLHHAHLLSQTIAYESPLQVLRSGNAKRALELIELNQSSDSYILWALLLAWELKEVGQEEKARSVLRKLQGQLQTTELYDFSSKSVWQGSLAAHTLAHVFELDVAGCTVLGRKLFGARTINGDTRDWGTFCEVLCDRGLFTEAIELRKQQYNILALRGIAELQAQKASLEAAEVTYLEIMHLLSEWKKKSDCISLVANSAEVLFRKGFRSLATRILEHLAKIADEIQDDEDRVESLLYIVDCQIEASDLDKPLLQDASKVLNSINVSEISDPYIKTKVLRRAASLSVKSGDSARAKALFDEALGIAQAATEQEDKQKILGDIAYSQAEAKLTADALETTMQMICDTHQDTALFHILSQQLAELDFESAFKTVERAYQEDWNRASGLQGIAQAQAEAQKVREAIETAKLISDDYHKSSAWTCIVKALAQNLYASEDNSVTLDEIFEIIETRLSISHDKEQALKEIAGIQLNYGYFTAAIQTLGKLRHSDEIAIAYAKNGDLEQSLTIVRQIDDSRIRLETFEKIARIQLRVDQAHNARSIYAEILSFSVKSESFSLKAVTLLNIADTQIERGQKQAVIATLQATAENVNLVSNLFSKTYYLCGLAEEWVKIGDIKAGQECLEQAINLSKKFQSERSGTLHSMQLFTRIAICQAKLGKFDESLAMAEIINPPSLRSEIYRAMARFQAKSSDLTSQKKLKNTLVGMYEELQKSSGYPLDNPVQPYCNLIIAMFTVGDQLVAEEMLANLCQEVKDCDDYKAKPNYFARIAITYAQTLNLEAAIDMLTEIEDLSWKLQVLWVIAYNQFKQNRPILDIQRSLTLAVQAYEEIQDEKQRTESVGMLARIQALAGEYRQAISIAERSLDQKNKLLPALADIFVDTGNTDSFKELIVPCSYNLDSAYEICHALVKLYPKQSEAIAEIVKNSHLA